MENDLELQIKVIEAFLVDEDMSFGYKVLEQETGATRKQLKPIIEILKRNGMIEAQKGLMNDDGEVVGSGWGLTTRATQMSLREWLLRLKELTHTNQPLSKHS